MACPALLDAGPLPEDGVWAAFRHEEGHDRIHRSRYPTTTAEPFRDWITSAGGTSYDSIIGSVGGGNHFAELQYVAAVHDKQAAYAWGFELGQVVSMVHSGSLPLGHQANADGVDQARAAWPGEIPLPDNKIIPMLLDERSAARRRRYLAGSRKPPGPTRTSARSSPACGTRASQIRSSSCGRC